MSYIKECFEYISKLEDIEDIINMKINDIEIWRTIRIQVGYKFYDKYAKTNSHHFKTKIDNTFLKDLYFAPQNKVLIFEGNKKVFKNGKYIDPITYNFQTEDCVTIDTMSFKGKYYNQNDSNHFYTRFKGIYNKIIKKKINDIEKENIKYLHQQIIKIFNYEIVSEEELIIMIKTLLLNVEYYIKVFKKIKPKKVIVAPSYLNIPVIIACHKLAIESAEVQYALISQYHLGYATRRDQKQSFYPDTLYVWSDYWKKKYLFKSNLLTYKHDISNTTKVNKNKRILIISQEAVADKVLQFTEQIMKLKLPYEIVIRKHPWDNNDYPSYITLSNVDDILDDINQSEVVITTFSTAFYEALYLNSKVLLIDDELNDVFDENIDNIVIKNFENLKQQIDNYEFNITNLY